MTGNGPTGRNPLDPGAQRQYYLSEADSEKVFRRDIVPVLEAYGEPQEQPVAVVLSAQPGAGKSSASRALEEEFSTRGGAVPLDVDSFAAFHPQLATLRRDFGEVTADDLTHADSRRWLEKSLNYLVHERRVNIVVEHGLRNPEVTGQLLTRFADAGYRVEAALLTTPAALSRQGILQRYQEGHEQGGGRDIDPQLHDQRYLGLLEIADRLSDDPRVTTIRLFRRDGTLVHRADRDEGQQWNPPTSIRAALETERSRPWTTEETREFIETHNSLAKRMDPTWQPRIDAAMDAAKPLLHPETASTPPRPAGRQLGSISRRPRPGLKNAHTATDRRLLGSDHDHGPDRGR